MPSPKPSQRKGGHEKNKKGRLSGKSSSFHGKGDGVGPEVLPRPRTVPDLLVGRRNGVNTPDEAVIRPLKLTKLLLNVTVQRSLGPVQVLIPPEATVEDLISATLHQYAKEARRPVLSSTDAPGFDLHYSQFSLESLDRGAKLLELGSRNFFLCPKTTSNSSCSKEAERVRKKGLPNWLSFMEFSL
ncbi:hypothetical protein F511_32888 [Dorcoceras hygrometricum]|uniref:DUF7054 domain-containing protein n=1 Tax=Dorcoceras hygrometricum TaxID=472368 RepID=A0A2Z7C6U1_9LAMI|nr:hypothetical protein F511_32888 [Dorcoceras hygrometricum]